MKQKTKIHAEDGKQDLTISREFDLPVELLFKAYVEPEIVEQWMGTKVLKLECKKHGGFQFVTTDPKGNKHGFNGVIHKFSPNQRIIRTFETCLLAGKAENASFGVQLEVLEFEKLSDNSSKLNKHVIYESAAHRDENLKLPFEYGINMAHDRLQKIVNQLK